MKYINVENGLVIKSWCDNPEEGAIEQAKNLSRLPFAFHHICLMPDAHQGYGMPVGGVLATKNIIVPNAVGVDIGCGMCAIRTSLNEIDTDILKKIMGEIRKCIPVGLNKYPEKDKHIDRLFEELEKEIKDEDKGLSGITLEVCGHWLIENIIMNKDFREFYKSLPEKRRKVYRDAFTKTGSLGQGNHFIEIQKGSDGNIWVMLHSGSRNLGKQVADFYNKKAIEVNKRWFSSIASEWELAFFPRDDRDGQAYLSEMQYCVNFALANRKLMMDKITAIIHDITGATFDPMINIAHNYARMENHFGQNVLIHRKGATSAQDGEIGIIPGSQGTASYIVRGKGNTDSFESCSHGAGRKMGRKQAERTLNLEEEKKFLDDKGIIHAIRGVSDLDEASGAYKDIDIVMAEQADLVDILIKLEPLGVIKG